MRQFVLSVWYSLFICFAALACPEHGKPFVDNSTADSDGPYVFYQDGKVVLKKVVLESSKAAVVTKTFLPSDPIMINCHVAETGDIFTFPLQSTHKIPSDNYVTPEKTVVFSDIEGNFKALKMMLLGANIMNKDFNWSFGKGHLVIAGDIFDRGLQVNECLWLLYKLEYEAEKVGGKVHIVLGNHEIMNLTGDLRYVRNKYIANASIIGINYTALYGINTELGRWLRSKNCIEKIGNAVICHGGISPEMAASDLTLGQINQIMRNNLQNTKGASCAKSDLVMCKSSGVLWYRGLVRRDLQQTDVDKILRWADAKCIIVGHTLVPEISLFYRGKVVAVDLLHEQTVQEGYVEALWIDHNEVLSTIHSNGTKRPVAVPALVKQ